MSTIQYELDGAETSIASGGHVYIFCANKITTLTSVYVWVNDCRNEYWNPETDPYPDYRWTRIETGNWASNKPTESHTNSTYTEFTGSGWKQLTVPSVTAYPGQYIDIRWDSDSWSGTSYAALSAADKFTTGITYSGNSNNINFTGTAPRIKAIFDIQEMLDEDILDFEPWDGYPVDEHNRPYEKGAWRITNAFDGYPYVCLPIQTKILPINEYLRENGQNIPLQRFIKETVNGQTRYIPLIAYYKEVLG